MRAVARRLPGGRPSINLFDISRRFRTIFMASPAASKQYFWHLTHLRNNLFGISCNFRIIFMACLTASEQYLPTALEKSCGHFSTASEQNLGISRSFTTIFFDIYGSFRSIFMTPPPPPHPPFCFYSHCAFTITSYLCTITLNGPVYLWWLVQQRNKYSSLF